MFELKCKRIEYHPYDQSESLSVRSKMSKTPFTFLEWSEPVWSDEDMSFVKY